MYFRIFVHEEAGFRRCEEKIFICGMQRITEKLAKQFNVEPRKLLSHVLEYKINVGLKKVVCKCSKINVNNLVVV